MPINRKISSFSHLQSGFTLIELLISIGIVAILAGLLLAVINPQLNQKRAKDGVRAGNVAKLAQAMEAHNLSEGAYPATASWRASPFLKNFPQEDAGAPFEYQYGTADGYTAACVSVKMATYSIGYFKYISAPDPANAATKNLAGKVLKYCTHPCSGAGGSWNNYDECFLLNDPTVRSEPVDGGYLIVY